MKNRWKEYSEELYRKDKRVEEVQNDATEYEMEPELKTKGGDRKSYNDWTRKDMARHKLVSIETKTG